LNFSTCLRSVDSFDLAILIETSSEVSDDSKISTLSDISGGNVSKRTISDENDENLNSNTLIHKLQEVHHDLSPKKRKTSVEDTPISKQSHSELVKSTFPISFTEVGRPLSKVKIVPLLLSIEGNIGAGKSYLLNLLRSKYSGVWTFIDEPLDIWTSLKNEEGQSLLEVFYQDQKRWSYTFQNCAILSRHQLIEHAVQSKQASAALAKGNDDDDEVEYHVFITERCLQTDYEVFTKMLYDDQKLDSLEYQLYKRWYDFLTSSPTTTPLSGLIYVDTNPDQCAQRITQRGRHGEGSIPIDYLRSLDRYQRNWVDRCEEGCARDLPYANTLPVIRIRSEEIEKVGEFVDMITKNLMNQPNLAEQQLAASVSVVTPSDV
jgi:deoxyadenosine/deoxycytidine kinase